MTLTPSEVEILRALSQGHTLKSAAKVAKRSHWTLKDHVKSARLKLGALTSEQAVALAVRKGII